MFDVAAELGISKDQLMGILAAISTASGAAVVTLVIKLTKVPEQIERIERRITDIDTLNIGKTKRLFLKARAVEDWILEHEVREGRNSPRRIFDNMRPDADAKDGYEET